MEATRNSGASCRRRRLWNHPSMIACDGPMAINPGPGTRCKSVASLRGAWGGRIPYGRFPLAGVIRAAQDGTTSANV
jgi:hypothetical protein